MDAIKTAKVWIGERKGITSPIHVSQYDTAWTFQFKVYKDDLIYEPENAVSVVFTGKKSDDTVFAVPAEFEDGVATVVSTVAMTSAAGIVECELRFSEGGETVGTANFDMVVEASPVEGGTPSESDFTTLQTMLDDMSEMYAETVDNAAAAQAAADTAAQEVLAETPEMVADWLEANVDPETGYVIDSSLSVANAAADAKAVGAVKESIDNYYSSIKKQLFMGFALGGIANANGNANNVTNRCRSHPIKLIPGCLYTCGKNYEFVLYEYDFSGTSASYVGVKTPAYIEAYLATDNATVVMVQRLKTNGNITDLTEAKIYISGPADKLNNDLVIDTISENVTGQLSTGVVLVGPNGTVSQHASYETTDYVKVDPGDKLIISGTLGGEVSPGTFTGLYGYDEGKNFVGVVANLYTLFGWNSLGSYLSLPACVADSQVVTVPNGVFFVRMSSRYADHPSAQAPKIIKLGVPWPEFGNFTGDYTVFSSIDWASGSIDTSGAEFSSTKRVRSDFILLDDGVVTIQANGQKVAFVLYAGDRSFLYNTGFKFCDQTIKKVKNAKYARIVVANADNSDITPSEVLAKVVYGTLAYKNVVEAENPVAGFTETPYSNTIKPIMHRGYNSIAPENTIPAFKLARKMGFSTIETDIQLTSDGEVVILHDATVNRTSNGTGNIYDMTLAEAKALDFGSWKATMWAETTIPTFEEMLLCCKKIGLDVYIEIKNDSPFTQEIMTACVRKVREYGMRDHVTWISFSSTILGYVKTADAKARLGYLMTTYTTGAVDTCINLRNAENEVIAVTRYDLLPDTVLDYMIDNDIPLCGYLFDSCADADAMQPYVTEALTNEFNAAKYIYEQNIG